MEKGLDILERSLKNGFSDKIIQDSMTAAVHMFLHEITVWQKEENIGVDAAYRRQNFRFVRREVFLCGGWGN